MKTEKLVTWDYYLQKLSLSVQNDELIVRRLHNVFLLLKSYDEQIDSFEEALSTLLDVVSTDESSKSSDLLEKIASCFNINRKFVIDFIDPVTGEVDVAAKEAFDEFNENIAHNQLPLSIELTDNQMRSLIFCAIMRNSYDGSYSMTKSTYDKLMKEYIAKDFSDAGYETSTWSITQLSSAAGGQCYCTFNSSFEFDETADPTTDKEYYALIQYFSLYFANMISIDSIGIYHIRKVTNYNSVLIWDKSDRPWDYVIEDNRRRTIVWL